MRRRPLRWALQILLGAAVILGGLWLAGAFGDDSGPGSSGSGSAVSAGAADTPASSLGTIPESELPPEGRETLGLVRSDGPFPYDRDGLTFQNREGILPAQGEGYYREYTVPTPGEDDRGARRIVGGEDGDRYYTEDHYASFRQIEEGR